MSIKNNIKNRIEEAYSLDLKGLSFDDTEENINFLEDLGYVRYYDLAGDDSIIVIDTEYKDYIYLPSTHKFLYYKTTIQNLKDKSDSFTKYGFRTPSFSGEILKEVSCKDEIVFIGYIINPAGFAIPCAWSTTGTMMNRSFYELTCYSLTLL